MAEKQYGLMRATGVGVGAMVGGGIFVLADVALRQAGPAAIVAFAINGVIAAITAISFADLSTQRPESGGPYAFARRIIGVRTAFAVGWVLWFASVVAAVLYAIGFSAYLCTALDEIFDWSTGATRLIGLGFAAGLMATYSWMMSRKASSGGELETIGKLVLFGVIIAAGCWALFSAGADDVRARFTPFAPNHFGGILAAMGYTFIAVQGFDLISSIAGEVRDPGRVLVRAKLYTVLIGMAIYLPLLALVIAVGMGPEDTVAGFAQTHGESLIAVATQRFMGPLGYWLVVTAALLATASALYANLLAASRIAARMGSDRTMPHQMGRVHKTRKTPIGGIWATCGAGVVLLVLVPDLSSAGAAASLVFLLLFALVQLLALVAWMRQPKKRPGWLPAVTPYAAVVGGICCAALSVFQAVTVPVAGGITLVWIAIGVLLYLALFSTRAEALDAWAEARDPEMLQLRGRSPLVLVPVSNPSTAEALVDLGRALTPPLVGRVLLLSVAKSTVGEVGAVAKRVAAGHATLTQALTSDLGRGLPPETLLTVAEEPWAEILRVAEEHKCESLLIGLSPGHETKSELEEMLADSDCDVAVLRAPEDWRLAAVTRVLVPVAGLGRHDALRARLLSGILRDQACDVEFLRVLGTGDETTGDAVSHLERIAREEAGGAGRAEIVRSDQPAEVLVEHARRADLIVMGLNRGRGRRLFGPIPLRIANETGAAVLMIGRKIS